MLTNIRSMKHTIIVILLFFCNSLISQSLLVSWGMDDIEGLTRQVFDDARKLNADDWLEKNKNATTWRDVFLTINNVAEHKANIELLLALADQITDTTTTVLKESSRLIIWDRIITGDLIFEGKGIVVNNDLFTVSGRANQVLQSALGKNFGYVSINTEFETLLALKEKWIAAIQGNEVEEWTKPKLNYENTIEEIANLKAFEAIVLSVQPNNKKDQITSNCLKKIYRLDSMPENPGPEAFCNPDNYSYTYLGLLTGEKPIDKNKDHTYWREYWNKNKNSLIWDDNKGYFVIE